MGSPASIVLVGGGTASTFAAAALRAIGYDGWLVLVGDETVLPYERPPLSKAVLAGAMETAATQFHDAQWWQDRDVELVLGSRAVAVDTVERSVELDDGGRVAFDRLLLATGGRARRLPHLDGPRVQYLRTRADAEVLADRLGQLSGGTLGILGAGFIGCEVAATARGMGVEVTMVEMADVCLQLPLGLRYGRVVTDVHVEAGVTLHLGEAVESVEHRPASVLVRTDRREVECELLLVAAGMVPNDELAAGTAIAADGGIIVDAHGRTSVPGIYAAGDVARPDGGMRLEHHDTAVRQGQVVARSMLGEDAAETSPPWFWSDQYDHKIQSLGPFDPTADHVIRGSLEERNFTAFQLADGRLEALLTLDRPRDVLAGRKLIMAGTPVDQGQLADPSVDLRRLTLARSTT